MNPITLYRFPLSGHCHRVELLLSMLRLPVTLVEVDLVQGEHKRAHFLAKNPLGEVPVIEDGDVRLADSNAILTYLALRYDEGGSWYPRDALGAAHVQRWFSLSAGHLQQGPGILRVAALFRRAIEREPHERTAARLFDVMEATLGDQAFLVGQQPTVADLAMYTSTAHAPEGGVALEPYPALCRWLARVEALPGFVPMARAPS